MVQQVAADRMPAIPVVGQVAGPVRNRTKAQDLRVGQNQVVDQNPGVNPRPDLGPEAGVTADIS